ncbi:putative caulimovirus coat protein [Helianthus anomalus]
MSSITQILEQIFDEQLETLPIEQINELVQLMSLNDKECEQKIYENQILKERYFPENKERIFTIEEEPETEESSSDIEISSNHRVNQTTSSSTNKRSNRKKNTELSMPYHNGTPEFNNNNNGSSTTINTIKIDCIFNFNKRKDVIDKWNTEISLIIQTNPEEFSLAKALLLFVEHKSSGIIQDFINLE